MRQRFLQTAGLVGFCLCLALAPLTASGGQDDPRLTGLFDRLENAGSSGEARSLINMIWSIWMSYDGPVDGVATYVSLGMVQMQTRDYSAAEESFTSAIEADGEFAEAWNKRATLRYLAGDLDGSILDIQQTLVREPRHFGALSGLGLIYMQMENWNGALAAFQSVLDIIPNDAAALEHIGIIEERLAEQNI